MADLSPSPFIQDVMSTDFHEKKSLFLLDGQEANRLKYVQNTYSWGKGLMVKRSVVSQREVKGK